MRGKVVAVADGDTLTLLDADRTSAVFGFGVLMHQRRRSFDASAEAEYSHPDVAGLRESKYPWIQIRDSTFLWEVLMVSLATNS